MDVHGFDEENIVVLMDDGIHDDPTKGNIIKAYENVVEESEDGDAIFLHYSGKSYPVKLIPRKDVCLHLHYSSLSRY